MNPDAAARLYALERDRDRHENGLSAVVDRVDKVESRVDVIAAKIGVYAALGSCLGGAIVAGIVALVLHV